MGLDVYVMPLWRFKAGDFTSPIEQNLGIKPTIVSLSAPPAPPSPPWYWRLLAKIGVVEIIYPDEEELPDATEIRARAVEEVEAMKAELTRQTGQPVDWKDEGVVVYGEQYRGGDLLRAFAAWHDHRAEMPRFDADAPEARHPVWQLPEPARRRFPTLVKHSLYVGYLLPMAFEGVHTVEPFKMGGWYDAHHDVASSLTIQRELTDFLAFVETLPPEAGDKPTRTIEAVRWCAEELQRVCALSIAHELPVIFYG